MTALLLALAVGNPFFEGNWYCENASDDCNYVMTLKPTDDTKGVVWLLKYKISRYLAGGGTTGTYDAWKGIYEVAPNDGIMYFAFMRHFSGRKGKEFKNGNYVIAWTLDTHDEKKGAIAEVTLQNGRLPVSQCEMIITDNVFVDSQGDVVVKRYRRSIAEFLANVDNRIEAVGDHFRKGMVFKWDREPNGYMVHIRDSGIPGYSPNRKYEAPKKEKTFREMNSSERKQYLEAEYGEQLRAYNQRKVERLQRLKESGYEPVHAYRYHPDFERVKFRILFLAEDFAERNNMRVPEYITQATRKMDAWWRQAEKEATEQNSLEPIRELAKKMKDVEEALKK